MNPMLEISNWFKTLTSFIHYTCLKQNAAHILYLSESLVKHLVHHTRIRSKCIRTYCFPKISPETLNAIQSMYSDKSQLS